MENYFVLYRGKEKLTCTWHKSHVFYNQTIHYIGVTEGLGGYYKMIGEGWIDRRFHKNEKNILNPKVSFYKMNKLIEEYKKQKK